MNSQNQTFAWLIVALMGSLFVLIVQLPRDWEEVARKQTSEQLLKAYRGSCVDARVVAAGLRQPVVAKNSDLALSADTCEPEISPTPSMAESYVSPEVPHSLPRDVDDATCAVAAVSRVPATGALLDGSIGPIGASDNLPNPSRTLDASTLLGDRKAAPQPLEIPSAPRVAAQHDVSAWLERAVALSPQRHTTSLQDRSTPLNVNLPATSEDTTTGAEAGSAELWQVPRYLVERLTSLGEHQETSYWAFEVERMLGDLAATSGDADVFVSLREHIGAVAEVPKEIRQTRLASELRRTKHALLRWLDLQQSIASLVPAKQALPRVAVSDPDALSQRLAALDDFMGDAPQAEGWKEYLLVSALKKVAAQDRQRRLSAGRLLAELILERLRNQALDPQQQRFISSGPLISLAEELKRWQEEPVDLAELRTHVDAYEQTQGEKHARYTALATARLLDASNPPALELGQHLEEHYRNCNLRICIHASMLQRMLPAGGPERRPVRDTILGLPVRGESTTERQTVLQLIPDQDRFAFQVVTTGEVHSDTRTDGGPATIYANGISTFRAVRPVYIGGRGISFGPLQVDVDTDTTLKGLSTRYDGLPLLGGLVHSMVLKRHHELRPQALQETEWKIGRRVEQEMASRLDAAAGKIEQELGDNVLSRLSGLALAPKYPHFQTSESRLTLRTRIAAEDQLAANTPRPRAFADSVISYQLHESVFRNVIDKLELSGKRMSIADLYAYLTQKLDLPPAEEELRESAHEIFLTFADVDPLVIRFAEGRAEVELNLQRLEKGRTVARDVHVRAVYEPGFEGRSAVLVRNESIQLALSGVGFRSRMTFRALFTKLLSKNNAVPLVPQKLLADPRFADLKVTSVDLQDGWIGVCLASRPEEVASAD